MAVDDTFTATSGASTANVTTLVLTIPTGKSVAVGKKIVLATDRADQTYPVGLASIVDSKGNTWHLADAAALRASIVQVSWSHADITTALAAGDTITVTWNTPVAKRNIVAHVCSGLASGGPQATTGTSVTQGVSGGPNGSSSTPSASLTTTSASTMLFGAVGTGASSFTPGSGFTAGGSVSTSAGSSDRALYTEYSTVNTAGAKTVNGSFPSGATWAEAAVAYALSSSSTVTVNAGTDQTVQANTPVTLNFTGTSSAGTIVSYAVTQTAGPTMTLTGSGPSRAFTAGHVKGGSTLTFSVTATDDSGVTSSPDTVTITVLPVPERILISGTWQSATWGIITGAAGGGGGGGGTSQILLAATPDPTYSPPRIRVDVSDMRTGPATSVTVTRRNADGSTVTVRTSDGSPLELDGGQGAVWDYEVPYGTQVTYYTDLDAGATTATAVLDSDRPWLVHPGIPSRSFSPYRMGVGTNQSETWDVVQGSFTVLGRSTPVITSGGARLAPASNLVILVPTSADLSALKLLLSDASPLFLDVPEKLDWGIDSCYVALGKVQSDRIINLLTEPYRQLTIPYQVVARPAGGSQATYTWDDVAQLYPTSWDDIEAAGIASWAQLANPTS